MLKSDSWAVPIVAALLAIGCATAARGQVSVRERLQVTGVVEAVTGGRITVRNDQGERLEVRVQRQDEQGVPLADGRLLAFPADVRISGGFDVARLKPGQVVRFPGMLNAAGRSDGEVAALTLIDADGAPLGVAQDAEPTAPGEFVACEIIAPVKQASKGRLVVQLPAERAFHRKTTLAFKVAADARAALESAELKRIEPGATVTRLDAVRLDTGDVVARTLVVETVAGAAVKERGDDALANKYRGLSAEPKTEARLIRSAHFAFLTDVSERESRIILDKLERMAGILERYFGRKPAGVVEGFIVRDLAAFPPGTLVEPAGVAKIRERAGVCFNQRLGNQRKATLYACDDHGVIQHECTHGFCHMAFGSTGPTWLAEGVAELGNYWKDGQQAVEIEPAVMAYLQRAQPKRRLLEIAVPGRTPSGGWQDYAWRWALCHMLANNPNYSDRFKPLAIALMEERPGVSFESVYGPVAREISFEYDQFLRTVGNGYRADLAAWPWEAKFRSLNGESGSVKAEVKARAGWQASGLRVERGVRYEAVAEGAWRTAPAGEPIGADGDQDGHGRLVAVVFREEAFAVGAPLPLGAMRAFTPVEDGQLFLRCDDDWTQLGDNDGAIAVTLRRVAE